MLGTRCRHVSLELVLTARIEFFETVKEGRLSTAGTGSGRLANVGHEQSKSLGGSRVKSSKTH